ncbi:hypothetical protein EV644_106296 [Kribbella orskensis]|uniref:Heparinase II/III-like protein n=1 Tax=Kribbella orskensis TaxID=2512216 RepID=A0ABY2BK62_9ACTN|nr:MULTISPECIES: hypothetical protein [Kribbella]TCN40368.1 hypothetical protein EV642_105296 [Kribbella sp. VKM Ac-2500]TCO22988.1 hypothetical protein EV644_106296 [Kribbella orskensis]
MQRRTFLAGSLTGLSAEVLIPGQASATASTPAPGTPTAAAVDEEFLAFLTKANEAQIPVVLSSYQNAGDSVRTIARKGRRLISGYVWGRSRYHHDNALLDPLRTLCDRLATLQHEDGLYDVGNLHSPPDSAFAIQDLCMMWALLDADGQAATEPHRAILETILRNAGPALATGGVHTPNHRWEVSAALARTHHLFPDGRYAARIDDWLDEGIDATPDGIYSERSATYASEVTNPCLLTIAWLRDRPELVGFVRRNLEATLYLLEPNGEVDTTASRRQDQTRVRDVWWYLTQFRELALHERDGRFATVAKDIERRGTGEVGDFLAEVLERPELAAQLPPAKPVPADFVQPYEAHQLARIRCGDRTATLFGGTDFHDIPVIASGLSTNPTFFKLRKGAAILDSVRLSPQFFSTGHFRSDGLQRTGARSFRLSDEVKVPYHLPLPKRYRRKDGAYALTLDGRFYASMDFPHRPKQYRTLRTSVTVTEIGNGFDLTFELEQSEVPFAIELCFRPGGSLSGVVPLEGTGNYQLAESTGAYTVGSDRIEFGPGNGATRVTMDPGERYTQLNGSLVPDGLRVYLTGRTPTRYTLQLRTS